MMTTKQRLQYKDLRFVMFTFGEREREKEGTIFRRYHILYMAVGVLGLDTFW